MNFTPTLEQLQTLDDFNGGDRVETMPHTDAWMQGDRFGTVMHTDGGTVSVWLDAGEREVAFAPCSLKVLSKGEPVDERPYVRCRACAYEKPIGTPCGEPCV